MPCHTLASALAATLSLATIGAGYAAEQVSDDDKAFVAKVSQGGMYAVGLGTVAETEGARQDIEDQGNTEKHDHMLVGEKLKSIATGAGLPFPYAPNAEFQARLDRMRGLSGTAFDSAYVKDMKAIHDADGAAFAKEAEEGTNAGLKALAAETCRIVRRHLGELGAKVT